MTFKTLTLTLTSPILLNHIKITFREFKPLQKYSRTRTLVFHINSKKATYLMRNLHLYVPNKDTYMTNQLY